MGVERWLGADRMGPPGTSCAKTAQGRSGDPEKVDIYVFFFSKNPVLIFNICMEILGSFAALF